MQDIINSIENLFSIYQRRELFSENDNLKTIVLYKDLGLGTFRLIGLSELPEEIDNEIMLRNYISAYKLILGKEFLVSLFGTTLGSTLMFFVEETQFEKFSELPDKLVDGWGLNPNLLYAIFIVDINNKRFTNNNRWVNDKEHNQIKKLLQAELAK